ncbi:hypothetical protein [Tamlana crocina]|uniref:Uncharacterized protein n=1 Tax=Tamlana crocina TaxID=393006 RepID=A0ABX1DE09_9FLAO|nr:hypothetical protein [Tamlana crocina]NJX16568.1 hypothetical protein [Tamlana crocina]
MNQVVKIKKIEDAFPQKGVWYDYYGDIFVSVIPLENKKHIRRKAKLFGNKKDSNTSVWHLKWQYESIERFFGIPVSGTKTYEVPIFVDGEKHIIDSLVFDKIAIEFQHTLSVSLDEIDNRSIAHKKAGYLPYLVLDFTTFDYSQYIDNNEKLIQRIKKWLKSEYYKTNNLFLDFSDKIIRLSSNVKDEFILYDHSVFIKELLNLEKFLKKEIKIFESIQIKRQKRKEERENHDFELQKQENREEKFKSENYEYFRKCFRNSKIRPYVADFAKDLFGYRIDNGSYSDGIWEKCYTYYSKENDFSIHYTNISLYTETEHFSKGKIYRKKNFTFLNSRVEINVGKSQKFKVHVFEIKKGKTIKLNSIGLPF